MLPSAFVWLAHTGSGHTAKWMRTHCLFLIEPTMMRCRFARLATSKSKSSRSCFANCLAWNALASTTTSSR